VNFGALATVHEKVQVQFDPECSSAASQLQPFPGSPSTMPNVIDRSFALLKCHQQIELSGGTHVVYYRIETSIATLTLLTRNKKRDRSWSQG